MSARAALLVVLFAGSPAAAQKPVVVAQAAPVGRLVADLKAMARAAAAPKDADLAAKDVDFLLEHLFGEKGLDGIDPTRPLGVYATVRDPFSTSSVVLVVPVTGEQPFLDLIDRSGARARPVEGKKGLFTFDLPIDVFDRQSHLRFVEGWAYLALNSDEVTDPRNLVPVAEVFDPKETAQFAARLHPDRVPAKWLAATLDEFQDTARQLRPLFDVPDPLARKLIDALFGDGLKLLRRSADSLHADAKGATLRIAFDPLTADAPTELVVTPRPGTALAKDVAARAAATNRFAGLIPADAAAGLVGQWPLFAPEVRTVSAALLDAVAPGLADAAPDAGRASVEELLRAIGRAVKAGDGDVAAAVCGPNADGQFTLVLGVSLDDPSATERELRAMVKGMGFLKLIAFDVEKAGGVSIHRATLPLIGQPDGATRAFGKVVPLCFALTPKGLYAAFGPDALPRVKAALGAKSGPAAALSLVGNPSRLAKLAAAAGGEKVGRNFADVMGTDDKLLDALTVTLAGGAELRLRLSSNVRRLPRLLVNADEIGGP